MASVESRVSDLESDVEDIKEQKTDIFKQQAKTIDVLTNVLESKMQGSAAPVYVQPQKAPEKPAPDYLKWLIIGAIGFVFWKGIK
ncbi:MAG: hypothetical protein DRP65_04225 [Planctomycetota bacterium]|nr:MAG: hypothetical protein DRP65_04225 [Planctomycetota bacterium]